jgi:hypothetical protein
MKYGLFAAIAFAFVVLAGGTASAGVATSGLTKSSVAPAASIVEEAGMKRRCYRRCRKHGNSRRKCRRRCGWWWY